MTSPGAAPNNNTISTPGARLQRLVPLLVLLAFAVPLVAHAVVGTTMRYSGDDYCYAGLYRQHRLLSTFWITYTETAPFNGNRYALTLASGVADSVGPYASAVLPALMLVLWVAGLFFALDQIAGAFKLPLGRLEILSGATVLAFATASASPDPVQSLYWRSALLPYLAPLALLGVTLGLTVRAARRQRPRAAVSVAIFTLALLAGGFSETAVAIQVTSLALLTALAVRWKQALAKRLPSARSALLVALAGSTLAAALMVLAPSARQSLRELQRGFELTELLSVTVENLYLFTYAFLLRHTLTVGVAFAVSLWLGGRLLERRPLSTAVPWSRIVSSAVGIAAIGTGICLAGLVPSAYALSSYPPGRALIGITFVAVVAVMALGIVSALSLRKLMGARFRTVHSALAVLTVAASILPLLSARSILTGLQPYRRWADAWDQRHAQILHARSSGERSVEVMLFDKIIPEVAELQPDPDYWYNNCAEWYYDLRSLSASLPGWDG